MTRTVGFLIWTGPAPSLDGLVGRLGEVGLNAVVDGSQVMVEVAAFDPMCDEEVVEVTAAIAGEVIGELAGMSRCQFVGMPVASGMSVAVTSK